MYTCSIKYLANLILVTSFVCILCFPVFAEEGVSATNSPALYLFLFTFLLFSLGVAAALVVYSTNILKWKSKTEHHGKMNLGAFLRDSNKPVTNKVIRQDNHKHKKNGYLEKGTPNDAPVKVTGEGPVH
jgi:hypothetical protein